MTKDEFYHTSDIQKAKSFFIKDGWMPLYERLFTEQSEGISKYRITYGYLIDEEIINKSLSSYNPDIEIGASRCAVYGDNTYESFSKDGFEPLVIIRDFHFRNCVKKQINISEELVFYFNLYEDFVDEQNKTYSYIEYGEKIPVIIVSPNQVKIKQKYFLEYLAIRKKHYLMSFRFESEVDTSKIDIIESLDFEINITPNGDVGTDDRGENYYVNSLVRSCMHLIQSWHCGKVLLKHGDINEIGCHYDSDNRDISFIAGYDDATGKEIELSTQEDSNQHYFTPICFRKSVLDKYYNDPLCKVESMRVLDNFFSLKCDNNNQDYVIVFFSHLKELPYEELLHWKSHNIPREENMKLSYSFYNTMILGKWSEGAETPDLFFKERFDEFNKLWKKKFQWDLFKPLPEIQKHFFIGLHIPASENANSFVNQIEALALILIDSINVAEISKPIIVETGDKAITKFEKYLIIMGCHHTKIIEFLRNLQSLRSGITKTHRFSKSNKDAIRAVTHFEIKEDLSNCIESSVRLFMDSIFTLNTLISHFELEPDRGRLQN